MEEESNKNLKEVVSRRIAFFKKKPEAALYNPKVASRHVTGLYTETTVREHLVMSDYGEAAGGTNRAPNPIELLLSALASCIEAAFYEFAVHSGFTIHSLSVEAEGSLDLRGFFMVDDSISAGFREIQYTFTIETPDDEGKIRELAEKVIEHCPVVDSLVKPTFITGQVLVKKKEQH